MPKELSEEIRGGKCAGKRTAHRDGQTGGWNSAGTDEKKQRDSGGELTAAMKLGLRKGLFGRSRQ